MNRYQKYRLEKLTEELNDFCKVDIELLKSWMNKPMGCFGKRSFIDLIEEEEYETIDAYLCLLKS